MAEYSGRVKAGNLYGTLEMLVLQTLRDGGPLHGLQIVDRIRELSQRHLQVEVGALYPALHRLHHQGLVEGEWQISEKRRRAKFYDISPQGRAALQEEILSWTEHTQAVRDVLGLKEEESA